MSELKTLKDIKEGDSDYNISIDTQVNIRAEAIKWVNHYNKLEYDEKENQISCEREIQWIIHFFDIKEDEIEW